MSRIGKQPVVLPQKVKVAIDGSKINVEGPLGRLERRVNAGITCRVEGAAILVERATDSKPHRMLHGLERSLINNMVVGVTAGFKKELEVVGIGYNVRLDGNTLTLEVGFANTLRLPIPKGVKVEILQQTNPGRLSIAGCDKHDVGQFAALVRAVRPPEPYQGKGIKYSDEVIRRKAGKAMAGAGG